MTRGFWLGVERALAAARPLRAPLSLAIDLGLVALAWNLTYLFRLGFERWISARPGYDGWVLLGVLAAYAVLLVAFKVPQAMWRFSGFGEMRRIALACVFAGGASMVVVMALGLAKVPRAVLALHPFVVLMSLALVRLVYRMLWEHMRGRIVRGSGEQTQRAIVLGAGEAARLLLAGIQEQGWQVLALLDDDPAKQRARIAGVPVLGPLEALRNPAALGPVLEAATHIVVALPSATLPERRRALALAAETGRRVVTVPSADELRTGKSRIERLREIEPEDLLGREPVALDETPVDAVLRGRTVLVTGGGGSIGSELCRQVARFGPAKIVVVELSEFNLYQLEQEFAQTHPTLELVLRIGDVKDLEQMRRIVQAERPQIVFHAAAYKHVPLMEQDANAWACLQNNTVGTWHTATAAAEGGVERFVLISTDKAVNPTSVMGATKRAAEMTISAMWAEHPGTRFMAVRFGNVLGSSGSVIPKFKEQIARGGPVTVTHPDMVRYFMTIPEASRLVLQAAAIGESGQVLVLDMGEPVKIVELARQLIRLSGHTLEEIGIEFSGVRAGEKMYEELLIGLEGTVTTQVPRLNVARIAPGSAGLLPALRSGTLATTAADSRRLLAQWVPEYGAAPAPGPS